jgi:hypothetical protein
MIVNVFDKTGSCISAYETFTNNSGYALALARKRYPNAARLQVVQARTSTRPKKTNVR